MIAKKREIRSQMREMRKNLSSEEKIKKNKEICNYLLVDLKKREPGKLFSYVALKEEPDLSSAMKEASQMGWKVYIPALKDDDTMEAALYDGEMECTSLGFYQPKRLQIIDPKEISLFWIPGVAFDMDGFRLGMGKGFYDRFLLCSSGVFIGIGWEFQKIQKVPIEPHDQRMDFLVTETGILKIRS